MCLPLDVRSRAKAWVEAWPARDLERIAALYADNCETTSLRIVALGLDASGTVTGKDRLQRYWRAALARQPDLHCHPLSVFVSPSSVVIRHANQSTQEVYEYLWLDANGLIVQGAAHHASGGD